MENERSQVDKVLDRVGEIKTFLSIVQKVNNLLANQFVSIKAIAEIIERDQAISANILRLANSSYYGLSTKVTTIHMAITVLGMNAVRNLITTISVFELFNKKYKDYDPKNLWYHSLGAAIASKYLLYKRSPDLQEEAFLCGLIHDIGKVIILQVIPEKYNTIIERLQTNPISTQSDIEREELGYSHADVGSYLAKRWHFPQEYCNAILLHHRPKNWVNMHINQDIDEPHEDTKRNPKIQASKKPDEEIYDLIHASVYVGNQIAKAISLGKSTDEKVREIDNSVWKVLELSEKELSDIMLKIKNDYDEAVSSWELE